MKLTKEEQEIVAYVESDRAKSIPDVEDEIADIKRSGIFMINIL